MTDDMKATGRKAGHGFSYLENNPEPSAEHGNGPRNEDEEGKPEDSEKGVLGHDVRYEFQL